MLCTTSGAPFTSQEAWPYSQKAGRAKNRPWNNPQINISINYPTTCIFIYLFFFEGKRESIPFIRFSKKRERLIWSSKRDGCQTSVLHKAGTHHICIDYRPFSECWHIYELWVASLFFFLLNWVRVGPPIQPKCRWGYCDWTATYTIGNKFWEMKSVIRPLIHATENEMGYITLGLEAKKSLR